MIVAYICLVPAIAAQRMNKQADVSKITFVSPPNLQNLREKPLKNLFDNDSECEDCEYDNDCDNQCSESVLHI